MKVSDYHYQLPENLIAQYPLQNRSESRLLTLDRNSGLIRHKKFNELLQLLEPGDRLVFNDTKVIPARIMGNKETGGRIELLLERIISPKQAKFMLKASKAPKISSKIYFNNEVIAQVLERSEQFYVLEFNVLIQDFLIQEGEMPLPPYMNRKSQNLDKERYQTVYAQKEGAVAAPTAGLHFDENLLQQLKGHKIDFSFITLHVGAGTFLPVRVETIEDHKMHSEWINISDTVCQEIALTKAAGKRVIAVGTTAVRSLETAAMAGSLQAYTGETDIFIYPGFDFKAVDAMITNFHLPESTLLMLVSAFAGREAIFKAYQAAISEQYRFFSYGDAMLII